MSLTTGHSLVLTVLLLAPGIRPAPVLAEVTADQAYRQAFDRKYPRVDPAPSLAEYANAKRYDDLYLGAELDGALEKMSNKGGGMRGAGPTVRSR